MMNSSSISDDDTVDELGGTRDGLVAVRTRCINCNYDLRGLAKSGYCPECNTRVARSGHGVALRYANVEWLSRVHLGLRLVVWGIVLAIPLALLILVAVSTTDNVPAHWWEDTAVFSSVWQILVMWVLWHACWIYYPVAIFLLTTPEPRLRYEERVLSVRRALRFSAGLLFVGGVLRIAGHWRPPPGAWVDYTCTYAAEQLSVVAASVLLMVYMTGFAPRIGRPTLRKRANVVAVASGCCMLLLAYIPVVGEFSGWSYVDGASLLALAFGVSGMAAIIVFIAYVALLMQYSRELREVLRLAKEPLESAISH